MYLVEQNLVYEVLTYPKLPLLDDNTIQGEDKIKKKSGNTLSVSTVHDHTQNSFTAFSNQCHFTLYYTSTTLLSKIKLFRNMNNFTN